MRGNYLTSWKKWYPQEPINWETCSPKGSGSLSSHPTQEEALLWKMCSKLIHPSSWVINHPADTIHNAYQRQVLAVYVVFYGWGIIRIFHTIVWE